MEIQIQPVDKEREMHACTTSREGDWIVFTCPHCEEYENRINFKTKERISRPVADPSIFHSGTFVAPGLDAEGSDPN